MILKNKGRVMATCTALFLLESASIAAQAQTAVMQATDKRTGCTLSVPARWGTKTMSWSGACKNKRAEGNGVARFMIGSKVSASWFGDVVSGKPTHGVSEFIQTDTGGRSLAHETKAPYDKTIDEGTMAIKALSKANEAALSLAAQFAKSGNKASANYYRKKAEELLYLAGE